VIFGGRSRDFVHECGSLNATNEELFEAFQTVLFRKKELQIDQKERFKSFVALSGPWP